MEKWVYLGASQISLLQPSSFASGTGQLPDRPHLDSAHASGRYLRGKLDSLVQVGGVNQIEASQEFFRLGERAVPDGYVSLADSHGGGGMSRLKSLRGIPPARVSEGVVVSHTLVVGHGPDVFLFTVNETQVFH